MAIVFPNYTTSGGDEPMAYCHDWRLDPIEHFGWHGKRPLMPTSDAFHHILLFEKMRPDRGVRPGLVAGQKQNRMSRWANEEPPPARRRKKQLHSQCIDAQPSTPSAT